MIKIYTDGSYKPSVNQGGYASIIIKDTSILKILYQGYSNTTNNRMELMGVLAALEYFYYSEHIQVYSDSSYIVESINNHYLDKWILEKDFSKKNMDLWQLIYSLLQFHKVKFFWVKGHNNDIFNELADCYANIAASVINPIIDIKV